jgi:hypothetical protein
MISKKIFRLTSVDGKNSNNGVDPSLLPIPTIIGINVSNLPPTEDSVTGALFNGKIPP